MIQARTAHWAVVAATSLLAVVPCHGQPSAEPAARAPALTGQVDFPIIIRFSEDLLSLLVSPDVDSEEPVDVVVLGSRAIGTARTQGRLRLDLKPADRGVGLKICFDGTCVSRTTAQNGPAVVYTTATTNFSASKPITVEVDSGFRDGETTMSADTSLRTPSVGSNLPRLRGRIVRRVAQRQVCQSLTQMTVIASRNAKVRIGHAFDTAVTALVEQSNGDLDLLRPVIQRHRKENPDSSLVFSTTEDYLQLAIGRVDSTRMPDLPPMDVAKSPVQIWLHQSALDNGNTTAEQQLDQFRATWGEFESQFSEEFGERFRSREPIDELLGSLPVILGTAEEWMVIGMAAPEVAASG